ncbi:hypothetical protein MKW98_032033 [Papaver atlanticum]|uniref:Uncharacterized protein n=1 Tax=Papaver atlanticum TaxID=357466 RepID=A0AAD4SF75_9MAGN|nr:hypothetical protein MKW98_032033 [Papaver atlanticum]
MVLIVFAGVLKNAEVKVDAAAICMNIEGWIFMVPHGFIAAVRYSFDLSNEICVRVSNELGAGNAAAAKFSVWVTVSIALVTQTSFGILIFITRNNFPKLFTDDKIVMKEVAALAMYLCISIFLCAILPVLSGMAIGAGWQANVAYVNSVTYYLIGAAHWCLYGIQIRLGPRGKLIIDRLLTCVQCAAIYLQV